MEGIKPKKVKIPEKGRFLGRRAYNVYVGPLLWPPRLAIGLGIRIVLPMDNLIPCDCLWCQRRR
jgi:hypothetical protein